MEMTKSSLVFAEVPLLFEEGYEREFDRILIVFRDEKTRITAVSARDGISPENVSARMHNQYDYHSLSDSSLLSSERGSVFLALKNDGSLFKLKADTDAILKKLLSSFA